MLKSRKSNKELERYVAILTEDCGEVLAESLVVRHLSGVEEEELRRSSRKAQGGVAALHDQG